MNYEGRVKDGVVVFADGVRLPEGTAVKIVPVHSVGEDTDAQALRQCFEDHFGAVDLGHPTGADNPSIEADLARAYADDHKDV